MEIHQSRDPAAAAVPRLKYVVSFSRRRLEYWRITQWLREAYWTHWQTDEQIYTALRNSIVIGAYRLKPGHPELVGIARVVSDHATNSMLTDLYVHEPHRRRGVARMLMEAVTQHDSVRPTLCVLGARKHLHSFYREFNFIGVGGDIMVRNPTP